MDQKNRPDNDVALNCEIMDTRGPELNKDDIRVIDKKNL